MCLASGCPLNERERTLVYDILTRLIRDVETQVRCTLSEILADRADAPRELILTLANDIIDVAHPVIVRSVVLRDDDLVQLAFERAEQYQLAIAERKTLSPKVTNALADTENPTVINAMLANDGAVLDAQAWDKLVRAAEDYPVIQPNLIGRKDLNERQAARIYRIVGEALRKQVRARFRHVEFALNTDIGEAVDQAIDQAMGETDFLSSLSGEARALSLADPTADEFKPLPRLLVRALEEGDIFRFEELFQDITGLDQQGATRVLYDSGPEAIAIACKACGLDGWYFGDIVAHLQGGGDPIRFKTTSTYHKIMDYFERIDRKGAVTVLNAWRSNSGEAGI